MELFVKNAKAICPECSGVVRTVCTCLLYQCFDCGTKYRVVGKGYAEAGLKVERLS